MCSNFLVLKTFGAPLEKTLKFFWRKRCHVFIREFEEDIRLDWSREKRDFFLICLFVGDLKLEKRVNAK